MEPEIKNAKSNNISKYPPLPDKTVILTAAQHQQLCYILETINCELIFQASLTKQPKKEYHAKCTFYFEEIRDNEIKTFKELLHRIYSASYSAPKNNQPLLNSVKEAAKCK